MIIQGTSYFVAVEVTSQAYLFRPPPPRMQGAEYEKGPPYPRPKHYKFFRNPLHDLESLWWIAVYFIVNKMVDQDSLDSNVPLTYKLAAQLEVASDLF